jgi:hypothetical protein
MVVMKLCPNCRSIQKAGTTCSLCKCPIETPAKPSPCQPQPRPDRCRLPVEPER